ncbi:MAG: hypothetical protein G3M70_02925 [Candidatus Nitronauta litoralis]|uniref:Uncharacterized protein n=1 Tax=Candidatus Nitronauta litoralis TaxID=2705533 RepID=A0A7T0BTY4_9BACT|nr:MAG: hypothetical protein G3M70_02925 [Candidatus Nitronauta litoralis]
MKLLKKKKYLAAALLFGLGVMLTVLPVQLPAQDIDDVIEGLDQDFSFGGKQDIKQDNVATANEQNREDIKIQENEAAHADAPTVTGNLNITFAAGPPTNEFTLNSLIVDGTNVPVNIAGINIPGGTVAVPISNVTVPSGVNFTLGLSLTCTMGPCNATLTLSGVINCTLATGTIPTTMTSTVSTTCSTLVAP